MEKEHRLTFLPPPESGMTGLHLHPNFCGAGNGTGLCWSSHLAGLSVVVLTPRRFPLSGVFEYAVLAPTPHAKHSLPPIAPHAAPMSEQAAPSTQGTAGIQTFYLPV